jgi:hypothetical protein
MAKGFGTKPQQLEYVLLLYPEGHAYAARESLETPWDGPFLGVTNMLDEARRWKRLKDAQEAIGLYMSFVYDLVDEQEKATVKIQRLERSSDGSLSAETMIELTFSRP